MGTIYSSRGYGYDKGAKFIGISKIIVSPADKDVVVVVGSSASKRHFISEDAGNTWRKLNNKWKIHSFIFHPIRKNWAILTAWTDACDYLISN